MEGGCWREYRRGGEEGETEGRNRGEERKWGGREEGGRRGKEGSEKQGRMRVIPSVSVKSSRRLGSSTAILLLLPPRIQTFYIRQAEIAPFSSKLC